MRWLSYVNSGHGMGPLMSTLIGAVGSILMGGTDPLMRLAVFYRTQRVNGLLIRGMNARGYDDTPALDWSNAEIEKPYVAGNLDTVVVTLSVRDRCRDWDDHQTAILCICRLRGYCGLAIRRDSRWTISRLRDSRDFVARTRGLRESITRASDLLATSIQILRSCAVSWLWLAIGCRLRDGRCVR